MTEERRESLYEGKRIDLFRVFRTNRVGRVSEYEWVKHPGAVAVLPFLDDHTILLIENERFAVEKTLLEIPAGTLEKDEDPEAAAKRELREETGYEAGRWTFLFSHYPSPGFCNERIFCYAAHNLTFRGQMLEDSETILVTPHSFSEAVEKIRSGEIVDGKTISTLLFWNRFCP